MMMDTKTLRLFSAARTALLLDEPFFGSLALRLTPVAGTHRPTAWTDGVVLGVNPEWFAELTPRQRVGLIAHEVMHCAAGHPWRRDGREMGRWNQAADFAINGILEEAGFELPEGGLRDAQYDGLSSEAIYSQLPVSPPGGDPGGDGTGWGDVDDSPTGTDAPDPKEAEAEWKQATMESAIREKARRGSVPAGIQRILDAIKQPACRDLVAALLEFAAHSAREDYSWRLPNPRYVAQGLYLPCLRSEAMPPIAAAVDTSGSVDGPLLAEFAGALQVVLDECRPESLRVLACDAAVHADREYLPGDLVSGKQADFPGGGGTDFRPVFAELDKEPPVAAIYLTDLAGRFPDREPSFPVLWVVKDEYGQRARAPFGQTIWMP